MGAGIHGGFGQTKGRSANIYTRRKGYTHQKEVNGHKVIPKPLFNKLINKVKKSGAIITQNEEAEAICALQGGSACTIEQEIFLTESPTISDLLEEIHHFYQNKNHKNYDKDATERMLLNEIETQHYLLDVCSKKYNIPKEEIEQTKKNLRDYEISLKEYYRRMYYGY